MNKPLVTSIAIATVFLISGCQSTPQSNTNKFDDSIPQWVLESSGFEAASCVVASNSFSTDKTQATTQARKELASQLDTHIASFKEQYSEKITELGLTNTKVTFSEVTTQLTDQYLRGSTVKKIEYAKINNVRNLCALVVIPDADAKRLMSSLLKKSPVKLDPQNETLLFLQFLKSQPSL